MKILYASDIHSEHRRTNGIEPFISNSIFYNSFDVDVIILPGDIASIYCLEDFIISINKIFDNRIPILFTTGNHEYYSQKYTMKKIDEYIKDISNRIPNFYYLQNESIIINGYYFFGSTMWSSLDCAYPIIPETDSHYIKYNEHNKIDTENIKELFDTFNHKLDDFLLNSPQEKSIVFTHFSPSIQFENVNIKSAVSREDMFLSYYFNANMDHVLNDKTKCPVLWIFGHTHYSIEKTLSSGCQVISNQIGYEHEKSIFGNSNLLKIFTF